MLKAELLTEISQAQLLRYMSDPSFGVQEKFNGERRIICKDDNGIRDFNRDGDRGKGLKQIIKDILMAHRLKQFVIDIELCDTGNKIVVLDSLCLGAENLVHDKYEYREARSHAEFDDYSPRIEVVYTAREESDKRQLTLRLMNEDAEGVVVRDMRCTFKQGRCNQHKKFPFWKTVDAVVIGPSPEGKDSIRVGCYDERGVLHEICGVSLGSASCTEKPVKGGVVQVRYKKGTRDRKVMEPYLLHVRHDKKPKDCVLTQVRITKNWKTA